MIYLLIFSVFSNKKQLFLKLRLLLKVEIQKNLSNPTPEVVNTVNSDDKNESTKGIKYYNLMVFYQLQRSLKRQDELKSAVTFFQVVFLFFLKSSEAGKRATRKIIMVI